jgi:hypothetical protein
MTHLKDEQYYIDVYDRYTVERCREVQKNCRESSDIPKPDNLKDVPEEVLAPWHGLVADMSVHWLGLTIRRQGGGKIKQIICVNLILSNYQTNKGLHDTTNATFYSFGSNSIAYLEQAFAQNE